MPFRLLAVASAVVLMAGLVSGCMTSARPVADQVPDWIESPPRDERYYYGLGISGRTRKPADAWDQAALRARAELGKTIVSQVVSYDIIVSTERSEYTRQLIHLLSDTELNYTEIIERWRDRLGVYGARDHYYVLVRMEKKHAQKLLQRLR